MPERTVCAAIVGLANVGKSTLVNALVGERIAITSAKPQTTRSRMLGVLTRGEVQFMFLDTPGFHNPKTKLGEHMIKAVRESVTDVDCAVFMTWPKAEFNEDELRLLAELKASRAKTILCINKTDTLKKSEDGPVFTAALGEQFAFDKTVLVSALNGDGLDELLDDIAAFAVEGPHLYDDDALTDVPERVIAAELIRESLLENLRDELPHGCAVSVERFSERGDRPLIDIEAEIICEKESHKGMIIGKGGAMLKTIGVVSREKLESFMNCKINLKLWVKVREGWRDKEQYLKSYGL